MTPYGKLLREHLQANYAPQTQLFAADYGQGQGSPGVERTITGPDERPVSPAPATPAAPAAPAAPSAPSAPATPAAPAPSAPSAPPSQVVQAVQDAFTSPSTAKNNAGPSTIPAVPDTSKTISTPEVDNTAADWWNHPALYASDPNAKPAQTAAPNVETPYPDQYAAQADYYKSPAFQASLDKIRRGAWW